MRGDARFIFSWNRVSLDNPYHRRKPDSKPSGDHLETIGGPNSGGSCHCPAVRSAVRGPNHMPSLFFVFLSIFFSSSCSFFPFLFFYSTPYLGRFPVIAPVGIRSQRGDAAMKSPSHPEASRGCPGVSEGLW